MVNMPTGVFRLKGSMILEAGKRKGIENIHQVSMRSGVSYPTAYRYIEKPEKVEAVSLRALYGVLVDGIGMSPEEIANMRLGDLFELVPDQEAK
jgi:hypothetical protein